MLVKIILLFLLLMAFVALLGRVLFPGALPKVLRRKATPPVCARCKRHLIGKTACDCEGKRK